MRRRFALAAEGRDRRVALETHMALGASTAVMILLLLAIIILTWLRPRRSRSRRRPGSVGPAASGAFYELLNEERRNAIEIVVEDRAAYRDPEDAEGDLPKLEQP